jgi:hypothetical protein
MAAAMQLVPRYVAAFDQRVAQVFQQGLLLGRALGQERGGGLAHLLQVRRVQRVGGMDQIGPHAQAQLAEQPFDATCRTIGVAPLQRPAAPVHGEGVGDADAAVRAHLATELGCHRAQRGKCGQSGIVVQQGCGGVEAMQRALYCLFHGDVAGGIHGHPAG